MSPPAPRVPSPRTPAAGRELSPFIAVLWAFGALALLAALSFSLVAVSPGSDTDPASVGALTAIAFLCVTSLVLRVHLPGRSLADATGLRPTHPLLTLSGLLLGVTLHVPAESLRSAMERVSPTPDSILAQRALFLETSTTLELVVLLLAVACVAPLVEELFVRGALFGGITRAHGPVVAAGVTALTFVILHLFQWRSAPAVLLVGLVAGYLRAASGSLLPSLALHVAFNASTVVALTAGLASATRPLDLGEAVTGVGWGVVACLTFAAQWVANQSEAAARARGEDQK
jgi:membrane protease YdiL (CAAX protease family)